MRATAPATSAAPSARGAAGSAPRGVTQDPPRRYRVWRDGALDAEVSDITELWTDDMVGFCLGCSFSWENVLKDAGLCPRQIEEGCNVPMFRTTSSIGGRPTSISSTRRPYRYKSRLVL